MVRACWWWGLPSVQPGKLSAMHVRACRWRSVAWLEPPQAGCAGGGARPCIWAARSAYAMHMQTNIWTMENANWFLKDLAVPGRAVLVAVQGSCDSLITVMTCQ